MKNTKIALMFLLTSCASVKFSPQNDYRYSGSYTKQSKHQSIEFTDTISMHKILLAIGELEKNDVVSGLSINIDSVVINTEKSISRRLQPVEVKTHSLKAIKTEKFAFTDYYSRKFPIEEIRTTSTYSKHSILPYVELSVRSHPEYEGDGLWGSAARTGNRLYWVYYGMILSLRENDKEIFSNGVYYTELIAVSEDSIPVFDFPASRIDSLVSLCLTDFPFKNE